MISSLRISAPANIGASVLAAFGVLGACALITVASALSPKLALEGCIAAVVVVCMVWFPAFGMAILVSFFVIEKSPVFQHYGVLASGSGTLTDVGAAVVLLGVGVEWVFKRTDPFSLVKGAALMPFLATTAFFLWTIVTCLWASVPSSLLVTFARNQVEAPILLLVALVTLRDRGRVRWAMGAYAISGTLMAVYVAVNFASLHGLASGPLTLAQEQAYRGGQIGFNQNELSVILTAVPAMTYLATEEFKRTARFVLTLVTIPVVGFALVVLTSRGTFISLGVAFVVALILAKGGSGRAFVTTLVASALGLFALISAAGGLPWYFTQRFQLASTDQIGGRGPVWQYALGLFERHPLGLGALALENLLLTANVGLYLGVQSSQSSYLGGAVDYGIVGFVLLIAMLFLLGREIVFGADRRNPATILVMTVLLVSIASGDYASTHWFWVIMSLLFCYALTARPQITTASEERTPNLRPVSLPSLPTIPSRRAPQPEPVFLMGSRDG